MGLRSGARRLLRRQVYYWSQRQYLTFTITAPNITITDPTAASYLTAWPDGAIRPTASDLNWIAGATVPNLAVIKLGANGKLNLYNAAGSTDVIIDVTGWYR